MNKEDYNYYYMVRIFGLDIETKQFEFANIERAIEKLLKLSLKHNSIAQIARSIDNTYFVVIELLKVNSITDEGYSLVRLELDQNNCTKW